VAVQVGGGPNINDNPRLRLAFDKARSSGMNMEAIERAINKAAGIAVDGKQMVELTYEGYAPGGVAVVVVALTDNRTRTAPEIKKIFERVGGSMGVPGCVAWQFKDKSVFLCEGTSEDAVIEALLAANADAEEIAAQDGGDDAPAGQVSITAAPQQFDLIAKALAAAKVTVVSSDITKLPDNGAPVGDLAQAKAVHELIEALDDHEDVQGVYHNAEFAPEIALQLES
jgi:YebC/PmpR family DNA-binding regulatory protein